MKVVVAGASGLIGRRLVQDLIDAGHQVIVISHDGSVARGTSQLALLLANASAVISMCGVGRLRPTAPLVAAIASLPPADRPAALIIIAGAGARIECEDAADKAEELWVRVVLLRMSRPTADGTAIDDALRLIRGAITGWDISGPVSVAEPGQNLTHLLAQPWKLARRETPAQSTQAHGHARPRHA